MYEDNKKFYVQQNRLKEKLSEQQTQIESLEKELCPECKKKFKKIFE